MLTLVPALTFGLPLATPSASMNASARAWSALLTIALASPLVVATREPTICVPPPEPLETDERCTPGVLDVAGDEALAVTACLFLGSQLRMLRVCTCCTPETRGRKLNSSSCHFSVTAAPSAFPAGSKTSLLASTPKR
jgi:hypothetical protein